METDKAGLSAREWHILHLALVHNCHLFTKPGREREIFTYILRKTIAFHKFGSEINFANERFGNSMIGYAGTGQSLSSIYKRAKDLEDKGIVSVDRQRGPYRDSITYIVNAPACLGIITNLQALAEAGADSVLKSIAGRSTDYLNRKKIAFGTFIPQEDEVNKVEELLKQDAEDRAKRAEARKAKKKAKWRQTSPDSITADRLLRQVVVLCEEHGVPHYEPLATANERKRLYRSARNFLDYCLEDGADPKEVIKSVVENWPYLARTVMKAGGRTRLLREVMSFSEFFTYRREIIPVLRAAKHSSSADGVRVGDTSFKIRRSKVHVEDDE